MYVGAGCALPSRMGPLALSTGHDRRVHDGREPAPQRTRSSIGSDENRIELWSVAANGASVKDSVERGAGCCQAMHSRTSRVKVYWVGGDDIVVPMSAVVDRTREAMPSAVFFPGQVEHA